MNQALILSTENSKLAELYYYFFKGANKARSVKCLSTGQIILHNRRRAHIKDKNMKVGKSSDYLWGWKRNAQRSRQRRLRNSAQHPTWHTPMCPKPPQPLSFATLTKTWGEDRTPGSNHPRFERRWRGFQREERCGRNTLSVSAGSELWTTEAGFGCANTVLPSSLVGIRSLCMAIARPYLPSLLSPARSIHQQTHWYCGSSCTYTVVYVYVKPRIHKLEKTSYFSAWVWITLPNMLCYCVRFSADDWSL